MTSTRFTVSPTAAGKEEKVNGAFGVKAPLADKLTPAYIQGCLFNEFEMGSVQPAQNNKSEKLPDNCYDQHLF